MPNNSSKKSSSPPIIKPGATKTVAISDKENEIFKKVKADLSQRKVAIIEEIPTKKVNSFIEEHLESILLSFIGFALPIYIRILKRQELIAGNEFWSKISLLLILPILVISFLLFLDFSKEKKFFRLFLTMPAFFSSLLFVVFLFSIQRPHIRSAQIIQEYQECFRTNQSICSNIQKGIYEDFLLSKDGKILRSDESTLTALAEGIRPHSIWGKLGIGESPEQKTLQEEFVRRGLVYYLSKQELGQSTEEIFADYSGSGVFYSLAFAEANSHLLALDTIPDEVKSKLSLNPTSQFPIGILNEEQLATFYKNILSDIKSLNKEETFLAMYFLTQFSVDLDQDSFSILMGHWITFNTEFENELNQLAYIRNQVREQMLAIKKEDLLVGVNFLEESDFDFYRPFLISTGIPFTKGQDISFTFHLQLNADNNSKPLNQIIFPEIPSIENEIPIYPILTHTLTEEQKQIYQTSGEETWIYALPTSLVCKNCH